MRLNVSFPEPALGIGDVHPALLVRETLTIQRPLAEASMKNIYVGNLSFHTTEEELRKAFETHGKVDKVYIVTDKDTGQRRGFGFVEMSNDAEAEKAIAGLNGTPLQGRALKVNEARPKGERTASTGERGRSGGRDRY
jgi:RNA recognition motif-containing protein